MELGLLRRLRLPLLAGFDVLAWIVSFVSITALQLALGVTMVHGVRAALVVGLVCARGARGPRSDRPTAPGSRRAGQLRGHPAAHHGGRRGRVLGPRHEPGAGASVPLAGDAGGPDAGLPDDAVGARRLPHHARACRDHPLRSGARRQGTAHRDHRCRRRAQQLVTALLRDSQHALAARSPGRRRPEAAPPPDQGRRGDGTLARLRPGVRHDRCRHGDRRDPQRPRRPDA